MYVSIGRSVVVIKIVSELTNCKISKKLQITKVKWSLFEKHCILKNVQKCKR